MKQVFALFTAFLFLLPAAGCVSQHDVDSAYERGKTEAYQAAYQKGYDAGKEKGYEEGSEAGEESGYDKGYETGYNDAWGGFTNIGNEYGSDYASGYADGFNEGYYAYERELYAKADDGQQYIDDIQEEAYWDGYYDASN